MNSDRDDTIIDRHIHTPKDMQTMSCQRIIVKPSIVRTISNAIVLIWIYLYYLWDGSSTWRKKNDNLKLLLFLFCLNLWKFQGYDRVAVVSDKIDKQKYTTYLAPHARLPVDLFFQCIRFFKYCLWMYRHTYIYTLFVDRFAVVVFIAFSAICMGRVSVSLRFFLFFGLTCVRISCDSFLNYCFVFFFFLSIVFVVVLECTNIYLQRCF